MTKIQLITRGKYRTSYLGMIFQLLRHSEKNIFNNFSFGYLITKTQIVFYYHK